MRIALIIFLLSLASPGYTQRVDSLESILKTEISDSVRVITLLELAREVGSRDFERMKSAAEEILRICEKNGFKRAQVQAYYYLGSYGSLTGDFLSAYKYDNLGFELALALRDTALLIQSANALGNDYYDLRKYDIAYRYFTDTYRLAQKSGDSLFMSVGLHNVGRVFKELSQYDRAIPHFKIAEKISAAINDVTGPAYTYDEMGDLYLRLAKYDSALLLLTQSLALTRQLRVAELEPRTLNKIARVYIEKGNFETAIKYADSLISLHTRNSNEHGLAEANLAKSRALIMLRKYDQAMPLINESLATAKQLNAQLLEMRCYNQLALLWESKGDFKKAYGFFKQFKQLEDSIQNNEMDENLLREEMKSITESKDAQIASLTQQEDQRKLELKRQELLRNILVVTVALAGILLVTVYRSGQRRRKINLLLLQHQEEMERRSEELEKLNQVKDKFFSIISHDLRSPINALAGLIDLMDKGAVKQDEMPTHLKELKTRFNHTRTLLNNLLDWTLLQMDKINLQPVTINIHNIVNENIQLLAPLHSKKLEVRNAVPSSLLGFADSNTINLVIRNLITNAIKFTNDGGMILIEGKEEGSNLQVSVTDTGIGIKPEIKRILFDKTAPYTTRGTANEKGTGLGLILCKEFVEKNGGQIWVESEEGKGSTFYFTIPKAS